MSLGKIHDAMSIVFKGRHIAGLQISSNLGRLRGETIDHDLQEVVKGNAAYGGGHQIGKQVHQAPFFAAMAATVVVRAATAAVSAVTASSVRRECAYAPASAFSTDILPSETPLSSGQVVLAQSGRVI